MSTILETHQDPNYEPSHAEVVEYGKWLGMEMPQDEHLLWIAREGLKAPLPEHWKACKSEKGELYYFNFKSGQSIWDHPLDEYYKELFQKEKMNPSSKSMKEGGQQQQRSASAERSSSVSSDQQQQHASKSSSKQRHQQQQQQQQQEVVVVVGGSNLPSATGAAAPMSKSSLPPSGKTAKVAVATTPVTTTTIATVTASNTTAQPSSEAKALPSILATTSKHGGGSGGNTTTTTTTTHSGAPPSSSAASSAASSTSSEDERSSQDGSSRRSGKLKELKTLKTKKDMPGELRLDVLPQQNSGNANSEVATGGAQVSATIGGGASFLTKAVFPAVASKNTMPPMGMQQQQVQIPVESLEKPMSAPKCNPIGTIQDSSPLSLEHMEETSPITADIVSTASHHQQQHQQQKAAVAAAATTANNKQRSVSFSTEEVAAAQEGKKQQMHAEMVADLEQYRADEAARTTKLKEDFSATLETNLRKSKEALRQRNDQTLTAYEAELREDLRERKAKMARDMEDEFRTHRKSEQDQLVKRLHNLKEEISHHVEDCLRDIRHAARDGGRAFLDAYEEEQRQFTATMAAVNEKERQLLEATRENEVKTMKNSLQAEQAMVAVRLREIQGECNAKISVMKMENEATLSALQRDFDETKSRLQEEHAAEMRSVLAELKRHAEAEVMAWKSTTDKQYRSGSNESQHLQPLPVFSKPPMQRAATATTPSTTTTTTTVTSGSASAMLTMDSPPHAMLAEAAIASGSSSDESSTSLADLAHSLHAATQTTPAVGDAAAAKRRDAAATAANVGKAMPPPLSAGLLLSGSASSSGGVVAGAHPEDLRTLITEALREVFKGSPFIIPSPASNGPSSLHVSPTNFGREIEQNTAHHHTATAATTGSLGYYNNGASATATCHSPMNISVTPESFQEQRKLLIDERRRLAEAKLFVENQRASLDERRAQLKSARRHWKADVLAAKAQGIAATSKKGLLLQKVHKVLDKQAVGLQHDDNLLQDSEHWLRTKEQRLIKLEAQMEEHERSRQSAAAVYGNGHHQHDVSAASVDTTALVTGFFKPSDEPGLVSNRHHVAATNSGAMSGKGTMLDVERPLTSSGSATAAAGSVERAASRSNTPTTRSISPMLSKALERIERRLDKVASLVTANGVTSGNSERHRQQMAARSSSVDKKPRVSSRSSSRTRHVDFAAPMHAHGTAEAWAEVPPLA